MFHDPAHFSGSDIEARDKDNMTPLLTAVTHGEDKTVRVLLEEGANVSALTKGDQSVIHLAAKHNRLTCLQVIIFLPHAAP